MKNCFQEVSDNTPLDFRRSCLDNARLAGAGDGGAMQSHRSNNACFCHRGMVVVDIEVDISSTFICQLLT